MQCDGADARRTSAAPTMSKCSTVLPSRHLMFEPCSVQGCATPALAVAAALEGAGINRCDGFATARMHSCHLCCALTTLVMLQCLAALVARAWHWPAPRAGASAVIEPGCAAAHPALKTVLSVRSSQSMQSKLTDEFLPCSVPLVSMSCCCA